MINSILLQAQEGSPVPTLLLFGGIFIIFYFFFIRPQQKKQKDQKKFIEEIKKGDNVITIGGVHGKVVEVEDTTVTIDVDRGVKIKFLKSAISLDASKANNKGVEEKK
jgi:preprotein translocase subunit YajC